MAFDMTFRFTIDGAADDKEKGAPPKAPFASCRFRLNLSAAPTTWPTVAPDGGVKWRIRRGRETVTRDCKEDRIPWLRGAHPRALVRSRH